MDSIRTFFSLLPKTVEPLKDLTFLKILFPLLTVVVGLGCLYYGFKGIFHQETVWIINRYLHQRIEGKWAILLGIVYLIFAAAIFSILGTMSYYLWV